jgi:hypothetical protein
MTIWTGRFWKAATERAVKTVAQTEVLLLGAELVNAFEVDWLEAAGVGASALVLSYLTSLASSAVTGDGPSLTNDESLTRPVS